MADLALSPDSPFGPDKTRPRRGHRKVTAQELAGRLAGLTFAPLTKDISGEIAKLEADAMTIEETEYTPGASTFTTQYAKDWGKRRGYKILASEQWDSGTKTSRDIGPAADVLFATSEGNLYVQAAGRHERAPHREKFEARGGEKKCRAHFARFLYLEFVRGNPEPVVMEFWA